MHGTSKAKAMSLIVWEWVCEMYVFNSMKINVQESPKCVNNFISETTDNSLISFHSALFSLLSLTPSEQIVWEPLLSRMDILYSQWLGSGSYNEKRINTVHWVYMHISTYLIDGGGKEAKWNLSNKLSISFSCSVSRFLGVTEWKPHDVTVHRVTRCNTIKCQAIKAIFSMNQP